jgi:hypothetical protein
VYPNLALAKIARYHRQQGDTVEWVNKHQIFQITDFADFEPRKGFKCKKYFELFEL